MTITEPSKPNILPIALKGAPVLRQRATPYDTIDAEARALAWDMIATMHEAQGIGLAANQVGVAKRVIVIDVRGAADQASAMWAGLERIDLNGRMPMIMFNPQITYYGDFLVCKTEGCLSQPGVTGAVDRSLEIKVKFLDLFGNEEHLLTRGMLARVIQHEVDHLNGILFTDRLAAPKPQ